MTADSRFDRDLTALLEDLYLGPSPDYRAEAYATATHRRQRPSWTFPGRWLHMADIAGTAPVVVPVRWRTIAVAILVIALLVAALAIVAGSRQARVPAPFGPAANGLIVYPTGGDIYALDPLSGRTTALVTGDSGDLDALFSPDGTRIAFDRLSSGQNVVTTDIMVADSTGAHPVAITTSPIAADGERFQWAPDSRSIYVQTGQGEIWLLDATKAAKPRVLTTGAELLAGAARPPDGKQLLLRRSNSSRDQITVLDVATGDEHPIVTAGSNDLRSARWSTDGRRIVYSGPMTPGDSANLRLWIVDADGSDPRQVTNAAGTWADLDPTWSPDDRYIAFNRYQRMASDDTSWDVQPIGLLDVPTGVVVGVGPRSRDVRSLHPTEHDQYASPGEGWAFDWSPDGISLLAVPSEASGHPIVIDPFARTWKVLDTVFDEQGAAHQEWQRN